MIVVFLGLASAVFGAGPTPIKNLKLVGAADGNQAAFTNLLSVSVGSGTNVTTITSNRVTAAEVYVGPNGGTNLFAVCLTNPPSLQQVVNVDSSDVTNMPTFWFGGAPSMLKDYSGVNVLWPLARRIYDTSGRLSFDGSSYRALYSTNSGVTVADWIDIFRVYDADGGNGVAVRDTLTNHTAQIAGKEAAGTAAAITNGCASGTNLSGSVFSNGLIKTIGSAFTAAGSNAVLGVVGTVFTTQLTIGYSNNMIYFKAPLNTITGMVFNVGGSNIMLKAVN
jgi:hypothetical protein